MMKRLQKRIKRDDELLSLGKLAVSLKQNGPLPKEISIADFTTGELPGIGMDKIAKDDLGIDRESCDKFAFRSHNTAKEALDNNLLSEVIPTKASPESQELIATVSFHIFIGVPPPE